MTLAYSFSAPTAWIWPELGSELGPEPEPQPASTPAAVAAMPRSERAGHRWIIAFSVTMGMVLAKV